MHATSSPERLTALAAQQKRIRDNERKGAKTVPAQVVRVSRVERMLRQMDRCDAMGANWGWDS